MHNNKKKTPKINNFNQVQLKPPFLFIKLLFHYVIFMETKMNPIVD